MKILHTVNSYYPYIGGSEELVRKLSENLVKRGHDVTVFTSSHESRDFDILNGVKIKSFNLSGNIVRGILGDPKEYVDSVLNGDFDLMMNYAAQTWATDLLLPYLKKIKFPKVIATCGYSGLYKKKYKEYFEKLPEYLKNYDHVVYHSCCYQDKIYGDYHKITNYSVISNFADANEFLGPNIFDFRKKYKIGLKKIFLTVANHFREKGHSFVINAFLKTDIDDAILIIIGNETNKLNVWSDCFYECKLKEKFANGKIKLLTHVQREDVVAAYKAADLFLFGSKVECSPLVIFEAMASKTPWISTNVGNISELKGGILVEGPEDMADKIKQVMSNKKLYETLISEGFSEWKHNYTLAHIASKYEELYNSLL